MILAIEPVHIAMRNQVAIFVNIESGLMGGGRDGDDRGVGSDVLDVKHYFSSSLSSDLAFL